MVTSFIIIIVVGGGEVLLANAFLSVADFFWK
jgi:hypothetical protein